MGYDSCASWRPALTVASESPPESALRLRVEDAGLGRAEPQQDIFDAHGRFLGRVACLLQELGPAAEYFGEEFHGETEEDDDNARLEAIADEGYTIRVFQEAQPLRAPSGCGRDAARRRDTRPGAD